MSEKQRSRNYKNGNNRGKKGNTSPKECTYSGEGENVDQKTRSASKRKGNRNSAKSNDVNVAGTIYASGGNDFSWYNTLPELTAAAANIPFARPLGTEISYETLTNATTEQSSIFDYRSGKKDVFPQAKTKVPTSLPGVMFIEWYPTIGASYSSNSAINMISREIYSYVRHANSGASNYDAPDLMMYLIAMDSLYSMYNAAVRVYGLMNLYTASNRYMPKALIEGLGWDFNAVLGNMAQFRWAINNVAYKMSSLAVPSFMSYYLRHIWLNSGVYQDKEGAKSQMYAFKQSAYYVFTQSNKTEWRAVLKFTDVPAKLTPESWLTLMNEMLEPILASEDMGIMSGDILKAFGLQNLFSVAPIPTDYLALPQYNPEVLSQIQNLTIMKKPHNKGVINNYPMYRDIIEMIETDTFDGYIHQLMGFEFEVTADDLSQNEFAFTTLPRMITADSDIPDPAEVMVSTRLTNCCEVVMGPLTDGNKKFVYTTWDKDNTTYGTEIVNKVSLSYFDSNQNLVTIDIDHTGLSLTTSAPNPQMQTVMAGQLADTANTLAVLNRFDWNPTLPISLVTGIKDSVSAKFHFIDYYQETNNYSILTTSDLSRLHDAAVMSEFFVPAIGSLTRKKFS